ncbi:hypothetical protein GCM10014719_70560 [Planomonospora parontospora subsp. antibiotica]|nr:hypothetical protein GCM10014719_70560 [Planomonospora parontospora subsp. antibiotica]GII20279.1 hypothetical protein Ppa05_70050 [Planomonospora parontospora subsp. antibiotica]
MFPLQQLVRQFRVGPVAQSVLESVAQFVHNSSCSLVPLEVLMHWLAGDRLEDLDELLE